MPMIPTTLKYTGTRDRWSELAATGKQGTWRSGQQEPRIGADYSNLMATGLFEVVGGIDPLPQQGKTLTLNLDATRTGGSGSATLSTVTRASENGQMLTGVRMQATGGGAVSTMDLPFKASSKLATGVFTLLCWVPPSLAALLAGAPANTPTLTLYLGDNGFANLKSQAGVLLDRYGWAEIQFRAADMAGGATFGVTDFTTARVRIDYPNGQAASAALEVYQLVEGGGCPIAPLCLSGDDGWVEQYDLLAPIAEAYGLRMSLAVIPDLVGTAGYMTWDQINELDRRKHEINLHGPLGGAGSYGNYVGFPDRKQRVINDLTTQRNMLIAKVGNRNGAANCLAYPQGYEQFAPGNSEIREALAEVGIQFARGTNPTRNDGYHPWGSSNLRYHSIVGHQWASEVTEVANIDAIIAKTIANVAAKSPTVSMWHRATTGVPAEALFVRTSNFERVCSTHADLIGQGLAYNATYTELHRAATGRLPI